MNSKAKNLLVKMASDFSPDSYTFLWSPVRERFSIVTASKFFIGVMLDMKQKSDGAWERGKFFVDEYFPSEDIWFDIAETHLNSLRSICKTGFHGGYFALRYNANVFHARLKNNAKKMIDKYDGDPRQIWNVPPEKVEVIYSRFREFEGIDDGLAKMAQFILVRDHGVAGGRKARKYLKVKPDEHVRKVMFRLGLSPNNSAKEIIKSVNELNFESQADIDAVLYNVGKKFCNPSDPLCGTCPFGNVCEKNIQ